MVISITFKTPDAIDTAVEDSVYCDACQYDPDSDECDCDAVREEVKKFIGQWVKYGELVTIDFDTKAKTATVRKK